MKNRDRYANVACGGLDVHYGFSQVTMRDEEGGVAARERLEHRDRDALRQRLARWPKGMPVVLEGSFGWGWLSDEMAVAGLEEWNNVSGDSAGAGRPVAPATDGAVFRRHSFGNGPALWPRGPCRAGLRPLGNCAVRTGRDRVAAGQVPVVPGRQLLTNE